MEFKELLEKRRSVRSYIEAEVKKEDIEEIIKAALLAPTWKNSETGRYYVALSEKAINEVYESLPVFNRNSSKNAAYIVTTYKKGISGTTIPNIFADELKDSWGAYDLGLQNAYLLLKASDLGYDTLIMGLRDEMRIRELFNIPNDEILMSVIAIGKRDKEPKMPIRKSVNEVLKIK